MLKVFLSLMVIHVCFTHNLLFRHENTKSNTLAASYIWPQPQYISSGSSQMLIDENFRFQPFTSCSLLRHWFKHYYSQIAPLLLKRQQYSTYLKQNVGIPSLNSLNIVLDKPCNNVSVFLNEDSNEAYTLNISKAKGKSVLHAVEVWGVLRGLETFSQLMTQLSSGIVVINEANITDSPRFKFRGVMIDTSRHYLPKEMIIENIDAMVMSKLNVLHWHIVDDQSFPYESYTYANLSEQGAFEPHTHTYTQTDVADIIEYGRRFGVRVIPEFDTPGHTQSWGRGEPGLLTPCYAGGKPTGAFGPVDPSRETTYQFMSRLFTEIGHVFPDQYIHLGGDEVNFDCWKSNPDVGRFMKAKGFGSNYSKLFDYYENRLIHLVVNNTKKSVLVWQDVIDNHVNVPKSTIVHVWRSGWQAEMSRVTALGHPAVLSACWYLNYISYGTDWHAFYACDPQAFPGTPQQKAAVMGGAACIWGEYVDATNFIPRLWPRAAVVAERLWSAASVTDVNAAVPRLNALRCRMIRLGINAEPITKPGYDWCMPEYTDNYRPNDL